MKRDPQVIHFIWSVEEWGIYIGARNFIGITSSYGRSQRFVLYVTLPNNTRGVCEVLKTFRLFFGEESCWLNVFNIITVILRNNYTKGKSE